MFRKTKRKAQKASLRRKDSSDEDDGQPARQEESTSDLLEEARKRIKTGSSGSSTTAAGGGGSASDKKDVMHTFDTSRTEAVSHADLATSTAQQHAPTKESPTTAAPAAGGMVKGADGIFRADAATKKKNTLLAGPIRAAQHVRVTARFDYQPDICKDYKDTGFCGYGDTCIYLHDRGDTLSGWQVEEQWQAEQDAKKKQQEQDMNDFLQQHEGGGGDKKKTATTTTSDDGLPFACYLCRKPFADPVVVTHCQHYFCQDCILRHVQSTGDACPVCSRDMNGVFNQATKLLAKKRKVLGGRKAAEAADSWKAFAEAMQQGSASDKDKEEEL